jgi:hypothetical protein
MNGSPRLCTHPGRGLLWIGMLRFTGLTNGFK